MVRDERELKPILNGTLSDYKEIMKKYPNASFFDQHVFFDELYNQDYLKK